MNLLTDSRGLRIQRPQADNYASLRAVLTSFTRLYRRVSPVDFSAFCVCPFWTARLKPGVLVAAAAALPSLWDRVTESSAMRVHAEFLVVVLSATLGLVVAQDRPAREPAAATPRRRPDHGATGEGV